MRVQLMARRKCLGFALFLSTACDGSPALDSDPAYWDPPVSQVSSPGEDGDAADAGIAVDPACAGTPGYDAALVTSIAGAFSHRAGQPCLESCHEAGGEARLTFAAAGTVFRAQLSRETATGGEVKGVGNTSLVVDACGNFYATPSALAVAPGASQPYVQNPTFRRMDRKVTERERPGDCNQGGCHDFSGRLRWGIYY
jgi:hypothetical protein